MKTLTDPSVNWLYEAEPSEGTAGRRIGQPRGKTFGRVELDQRPSLQSRAAHGLRHLVAARQSGLELCRRAALFQAQRMPHRTGRRSIPRPRRGGRSRGSCLARSAVRGVHRGGREHRHPAQPRLQRRAAGGGRLLSAQRARQSPDEHRAGAPAPRHAAAQRRRAPACPRRPDPVRGEPCGRGGVSAPRRAPGRARGARGDCLGRRLQLAAAPAALGHRLSRAARRARDSGTQGAAPAWARTCATTTRFVPRFGPGACRRSTSLRGAGGSGWRF